ncbi:MAG: hypothetical protein WEA82_09500 [Idiomarina sp.]
MQRLFSTLSEQQTHVDLTMVVNELFYYAQELDALYSEQDMWIFHPTFRSRWRATVANLSALNTVVQKGKAAQVADLKSKLSTLNNVQL